MTFKNADPDVRSDAKINGLIKKGCEIYVNGLAVTLLSDTRFEVVGDYSVSAQEELIQIAGLHV